MMKENNFKKEAKKSTRELFKFPHKISVSHNDLKLFDIEIDIRPNKKALSMGALPWKGDDHA